MISSTKKLLDWCQQFEKKTFNKGEHILQYREDGIFLFFLEQGYVRLLTTTGDGSELTYAIHKPGTCFPLQLNLSDSHPESPYVYEAVTAVTVYKIPQDAMDELLETDRHISRYFLERFSSALTGMMVRLEQSRLPKPAEVVAILQYLTKEFALPLEGTHLVRIPFPLTAELLSTWTGVARETVTRVLSQLKKQNVLSSKHLYLHVDQEKLQEM